MSEMVKSASNFSQKRANPLKSESILSFESFSLNPELFRAISELGFTTPTPIQKETLPILLNRETDFLGLAATGTGKTAAFAIPLLQGLKKGERRVQALILSPTRELAKQTSEQINLLARYMNTKALAIYGGAGYGGQLRALKDGVAIVVGTPGRILDHLERGTLDLNEVRTLVLDEADEMISMGFKDDIEKILSKLDPEQKPSTWLFSATMSRDIRRIAEQFLDRPAQIQVNREEGAAKAVKQFWFSVYEEEKADAIEKLIDTAPGFHGLVFCQTKVIVTSLTERLRAAGYAADCLHGDMDQESRERTLRAFKAGKVRILIGTDVASRGIDVKDLTHVINYSLPRELDLYVHRIGRTGRGGAEGIAWSLVSPSHRYLIQKIEQQTRTKMVPGRIPGVREVIHARLSRALQDFETGPGREKADPAMILTNLEATGWVKAMESLSKEEIVSRFLAATIKAPKSAPPAISNGAPRGASAGADAPGKGAFRTDRTLPKGDARKSFFKMKTKKRGRTSGFSSSSL